MEQCEWGTGKDYAKVGEILDNEYLLHIPPTKLPRFTIQRALEE